MSIIFGKLNLGPRPVLRSEIQRILDHCDHFGADDRGCWVYEHCGLGHLKITNTPESISEKLPLYNEFHGLTITADARLDNRDELIKEFGLASDVWDSQIILSSYIRYGKECTCHLRGAFAFAIWNDKSQELFCARDQMGVRPLFYYMNHHFFAFSSEKRGLLGIDELDKAVNNDYVLNMLTLTPAPIESTFYTHIKRLPPAHTLTLCRDGRLSFQKYWDLDPHKKTRFSKDEEYVEAFLHHFENAVRVRLRSVKEVGAETSGGLDSSGIVAYAHPNLQTQNKRLHCFSNVMPKDLLGKYYPYLEKNSQKDERPYIEELCDFIGVPEDHRHWLNSFYPQEIDYLQGLDDDLSFQSGLDINPAFVQLPMYSQAKKAGMGVMLAGFPGDELVTAEGKNQFLEYMDRKHWLKYFGNGRKSYSIPTLVAHLALAQLYGLSPKIALQVDRLVQTLRYRKKRRVRFRQVGFLDPQHITQYPHLRDKLREVPFQPLALSLRQAQRNLILRDKTCLRMENSNWSARHYKMEYRFPLADLSLIEYVLSIPVEQKVGNTQGRKIFRESMKGKIPESIRLGKKNAYGFSNPNLFIHHSHIQNDLIRWLNLIRHDPKMKFINFNKLTHKAEVTSKMATLGRGTITEQAAIGQQQRIHLLLRYLQNNPNFMVSFKNRTV